MAQERYIRVGAADQQTYLLLHNASKAASAINELLCQPPSS